MSEVIKALFVKCWILLSITLVKDAGVILQPFTKKG